jgi:scyllo-inositol 2-dehydrogenase (NADP+)
MVVTRTRGSIGVGLIGYGLAGSVLHGPLIDAEERLQLQAVACGRSGRVHRDLPAVRVVATPAELLEDPRVELVVVAAPTAAHYQLATLALRAGRHVVVEKPMVPSSADADELIRLAERHGRLLSVFHQRRWDGDFLTVQRCLQAGLLGRVSTYIARWGPVPSPARGGLAGAAPARLRGPVRPRRPPGRPGAVPVRAAGHRASRPRRPAAGRGHRRLFHLMLGYGELRVILQAGSLVRVPGPRFEVHGDQGSLVKYGLDAQAKTLEDGGRPGDPGWGMEAEDRHATLTTELGGLQVTGRLATIPGAWQAFYRQMACAIQGQGPVPVAPQTARDAVGVLECAVRSSRQGRVVRLR